MLVEGVQPCLIEPNGGVVMVVREVVVVMMVVVMMVVAVMLVGVEGNVSMVCLWSSCWRCDAFLISRR